MRGYLRHRATLTESASTLVQRMQKALVQMNVQLPLVLSDITGVTGLRILRDLVAGQRVLRRLRQRAQHLGFGLIDLSTGELVEGTVS